MPAVRLTPAARAEVRRIRRGMALIETWRKIDRIHEEMREVQLAKLEAELATLLGGGEGEEASSG